jgi:hypothetical protein
MNISDEMVAAFRTAAFNRLMHEDGCPEGEQIKAGIAAIYPLLEREVLERAAGVADNVFASVTDICHCRGQGCDCYGSSNDSGWAGEQAGRQSAATNIAAAIRALAKE